MWPVFTAAQLGSYLRSLNAPPAARGGAQIHQSDRDQTDRLHCSNIDTSTNTQLTTGFWVACRRRLPVAAAASIHHHRRQDLGYWVG